MEAKIKENDFNSTDTSTPSTKSRLSSKIDKRALAFLRTVSRKSGKSHASSKSKFKEKLNGAEKSEDTMNNEPEESKVTSTTSNPQKFTNSETLSSVTAVLSEEIMKCLTEPAVIQICQGCGLFYSKDGDSFLISGTWDMVQQCKIQLDKLKEEGEERRLEEQIAEQVKVELVHDECNDAVEDIVMDMAQSESNLINENKEDMKARIQQIAKVESTTSGFALQKQLMDKEGNSTERSSSEIDSLVVIAPKRGQVHRLTGKCPELATEICDLCGYKSSKEGVMRHKQRRHPKTVYKCQVCGAGFGVRYDMRRHRLNHFTSSGELNKKGCILWDQNHPDVDSSLVNYKDFEVNFNSEEVGDGENNLQINADNSSVKEEGPAENSLASKEKPRKKEAPRYPPRDTVKVDCPICHKTFPQRVLAVHMKIHNEKHSCICPYCTMEFSERGKMNQHIRSKHEMEYRCELCDTVLCSKAALKVHRESKHGDNVVCPECNKELSTSHALAIHMKRQHETVRRFSCQHCGKKFFDKRSMQLHEVTHLDEETKELHKPFACSYCGKKFLRKQTQLMHENIHTGKKPYKCQQCSKAFPYASMLAKHMKVHSDVRTHQCQFCHKSFKFSYKLRYHMILHTRERKHVCQNCSKIFTTSSSLKMHVCKQHNATVPPQTNLIYANELGHSFEDMAMQIAVDSAAGESQMLAQGDSNQAPPDSANTLYMCGYCNLTFGDLQEVNAHVQSHEEVTVIIQDPVEALGEHVKIEGIQEGEDLVIDEYIENCNKQYSHDGSEFNYEKWQQTASENIPENQYVELHKDHLKQTYPQIPTEIIPKVMNEELTQKLVQETPQTMSASPTALKTESEEGNSLTQENVVAQINSGEEGEHLIETVCVEEIKDNIS